MATALFHRLKTLLATLITIEIRNFCLSNDIIVVV